MSDQKNTLPVPVVHYVRVMSKASFREQDRIRHHSDGAFWIISLILAIVLYGGLRALLR